MRISFMTSRMVGCGILALTAVAAAGSEPLSNAQATYQKDRANCLNGHSSEDRATCLKEAGAAFEEAKRGELDAGNTQYQKNALLRCQALKSDDDRQACARRMQGEGVVDGSVAGGGIFRELVIQEPARSDGSMHNGNTPDDKSK